MQFDRDDGDDRSSDDLDLSFDFQEAEGDDRKARDEDQDSWDEEQGTGEAADEPGMNGPQFLALSNIYELLNILKLHEQNHLQFSRSFSTTLAFSMPFGNYYIYR